jgi:hypothetical protein
MDIPSPWLNLRMSLNLYDMMYPGNQTMRTIKKIKKIYRRERKSDPTIKTCSSYYYTGLAASGESEFFLSSTPLRNELSAEKLAWEGGSWKRHKQ